MRTGSFGDFHALPRDRHWLPSLEVSTAQHSSFPRRPSVASWANRQAEADWSIAGFGIDDLRPPDPMTPDTERPGSHMVAGPSVLRGSAR